MIDFDAARQAALARLYRIIDRRIAFANRSIGQRRRRANERERRKHD